MFELEKKVKDLEFLLEISKHDMKTAITDMKRESKFNDQEYEDLRV